MRRASGTLLPEVDRNRNPSRFRRARGIQKMTRRSAPPCPQASSASTGLQDFGNARCPTDVSRRMFHSRPFHHPLMPWTTRFRAADHPLHLLWCSPNASRPPQDCCSTRRLGFRSASAANHVRSGRWQIDVRPRRSSSLESLSPDAAKTTMPDAVPSSAVLSMSPAACELCARQFASSEPHEIEHTSHPSAVAARTAAAMSADQ
jgi:hypothetical protein